MDTEYLVDFRSQKVTRCTAEVVKSDNYRREVKLTTSHSVSITKREKNRTSRCNPRLFTNNRQVNNSAYRDVISPPSQFRGLTERSSIVSLMLNPIASLVTRPIANLVTSPIISFIVNPIASLIVNPIASFIASPFAGLRINPAILSLMPSTIASPIVSKKLNEKQLIQIGTEQRWYHQPTDIPKELYERQLGTVESWHPTEINERKPIQTGTSESCHCDPTFNSEFSCNSHLTTATTIVSSSYFINIK